MVWKIPAPQPRLLRLWTLRRRRRAVASSASFSPSSPPDRAANRVLLALATFLFLLEYLPNLLGGYGYFIDELYYIACSKRLDFGYVDHPPLAVLLLRLNRLLFGDSIPALRLLPALAGAVTVFLTGLIARRLGAGVFGQSLAGLAVVASPALWAIFGFYSTNALRIVIWAVAFYLLVELVRKDNRRLWLAFGLVAGLGLQNKHTFVLLLIGLLVGLALTRSRGHLLSPWFWLGACLTLLILLPNLWWQYEHGWPSLDFYRNADLAKNIDTPPQVVLGHQVLYMNPGNLPLWLAGVVFFLGSAAGRRYRFLGGLFASLLVLMMIAGKSRPDHIVPAYVIVFAGGSVLWEALASRRPWLRRVLPTLMIGLSLPLVPLGFPILSPEPLARYSALSELAPQVEKGEGKKGPLPQWFADRFGWEELVAEISQVADRLDPEERARSVILVSSFGHAGAIELLGAGTELPAVCSPHNNYFLWGPPAGPIDTAITIGFSPTTLSRVFAEIERVATYRCDFCMNRRNNMPIYIARRPKVALQAAWKDLRRYE